MVQRVNRPRRLVAVLKLIEACNLACAYCYQSGRLRPGQVMTPATLDRVLSEVSRITQGPASLLWFGGEPTLVGLQRFREAIERADRFFEGRPVRHSLQTNAVLIDQDWAAYLASRRFGVTLSLDGPAEMHDARRLNQGGRGSHAAVVRALELLQSAGIVPRSSCVVDSHTLEHPEALVDYFAALGLPEVDFAPGLRSVGGQLEVRVGALEFGRFMTRVLDRWLALGRSDFKIRGLAGVVRKLSGLDPGYCKLEGDCSAYITFAHNGDVYPCDEFSTFPETRLGNLHASDLEELLDSPATRAMFRAWSAVPAECSDCRWRDLCRGGCPFERQMGGGVDRPSVLCEGLKLIYKRAELALR